LTISPNRKLKCSLFTAAYNLTKLIIKVKNSVSEDYDVIISIEEVDLAKL